jgi:signal transduction histidine kinase
MRDDGTIKGNPFLVNLLQGIIKGSERLYDIIESMIDVSMIDTQVLQLRPSPTSISNIIGTLASQYKEAIKERQIALKVSAFKNFPYLEADSKRLHQVFDNLMVNAIKYTPDGGKINVDGKMLESDDEQWIEVIVSDSGIGIDPEEHERIFEKFYQTGELALHSTGKTKFKGGGPGLGLAIAKGIIAAHGGKIWVESEGYDEKKCPGSRFHVILPVKSKIKITEIISPFSYSQDQD